MIRSRLAPTPSGYLHLGNAVNFILTWLLVRHGDGRLKLRIDDADAARSRSEYIADIFRQLEWLGLDWDLGPTGPDDFTARHSQRHRRERYRQVLDHLAGQEGLLFFCTCTRRQIKKAAGGHLYPGTCHHCRRPPAAKHTIRIRVAAHWTHDPGPQELVLAGPPAVPGPRPPHPPVTTTGSNASTKPPPVALAAAMGDFILWRRDDLPAYQLASLVDDLDDGSNLIVRGLDLLPSTAAQCFLAQQLGPAGEGFSAVNFFHHPLLTNEQGDKLAKSDRALSLAAMRRDGTTAAEIYRHTARFLGLSPAEINSLADLQAATALLTPQRSWTAPDLSDQSSR